MLYMIAIYNKLLESYTCPTWKQSNQLFGISLLFLEYQKQTRHKYDQTVHYFSLSDEFNLISDKLTQNKMTLKIVFNRPL